MENDKPLFPPGTRAYSYLRFSTPEQLAGDSYRRQTDLAKRYAAKHGLTLDEKLTYQDLGVSAYRAANVNTGRLGDFLEAVQAGQVPAGSVLLVENLDRISRNHAIYAQTIFQNMIVAGLTVVTLLDERVYSADILIKDPIGLIISILGFMKANEESAVKSSRLKEVWSKKRGELSTKPLTSRAPAWLKLNEDRAFEVVPDRAEIVRKIFAWAEEGWGQHRIALKLNSDGVEPWGKAAHWHRSYVAKILHSSAVVGTFTPHVMQHEAGRKRRHALEPVEGYFPAVVSPKVFERVQALQGAAPPLKGRQGASVISNILAGMATCPLCASTMTRVQKGPRSTPALVCTQAKAGAGCAYKSIRYQFLEDFLVAALPSALEAQEGIELPDELDQGILNAESTVDALKEEVGNLLDNLGRQRSDALSLRAAEREAALREAQGELDVLLRERAEVSGKVIGARIATALAALSSEDGAAMDRGQVNKALRALFKRAVINWPNASIDLDWIAGGTCQLTYGFSQPGNFEGGFDASAEII